MPDTWKPLRDKLWQIKNQNGGLSFLQMGQQAGLSESAMWRLMHGERNPNGDTLQALLRTWPDLMAVFLSDDVPDGNSEMHEPATSESA